MNNKYDADLVIETVDGTDGHVFHVWSGDVNIATGDAGAMVLIVAGCVGTGMSVYDINYGDFVCGTAGQLANATIN